MYRAWPQWSGIIQIAAHDPRSSRDQHRVRADYASPLGLVPGQAVHGGPWTKPGQADHRIMTKLNARDRAQLVVIAYESGLVTPGGRDRR
jgi:hypothetical protein